MAEQEQQNYKNHTRWYPLVHFVIMPLVVVNLGWQIYMLTQERTIDRAESLLMAIVIGLIVLTARLQALKVQDRVIRLEEKLRYRQMLSAELAEKACAMSPGKMIALRFASDEELNDLVQKVLNNELQTGGDIKQAVQNWRGDYLRT
jgi:hypothetical protein